MTVIISKHEFIIYFRNWEDDVVEKNYAKEDYSIVFKDGMLLVTVSGCIAFTETDIVLAVPIKRVLQVEG